MAEIPSSASPALADGLRHVRTVVEMHSAWETTTLRFMAERLAVGIDRDDWPQRQAADLGRIRRDLDATVRRLADVAGPQIHDMIAQAYARGSGEPPAPDRRPALVRRAVDALRDLWQRLTGQTARTYQQAITAASNAPAEGRRAMVQRQLNQAAARGLTAGRDDHGRTVALVPRVETILQTAAGNAAMDGYLDRLTGEGDELVRVTRSPHPCPVCEPWEDRVLSLTTSPRYPSITTARIAGLWHARCRHTIERYTPGMPRHPHAIVHKAGSYQQEQRQRVIERHIREWKRRRAVALDDTARLLAGRKVRQWEAALRAHLAATGLQRSRQRERTDFAHSRPLRHALGG